MSKILDGIVLIKKQLKIWLSVVRQHATNFNWGQFHFLLRGQDKKNPATLLILCHQSISLKGWGSETNHNTSLTLCLHTAHNQLLPMRLILWEPGNQSTGSTSCQARAILLHLRHYLSGFQADSYMLPFYTEYFTQTFSLSASFAAFFSFIFSW